MRIILAGRRRIKEKHINWKEHYGEKSIRVKKKFEHILPGSYFRWEGKDYESGHPYYVVVGPSESKRYGKAFFAGVKKMPKDPEAKVYSPSGKYFMSLSEALRHANDMWGTPLPKDRSNYSAKDLVGLEIPKHIKG
jgi:hypothetical protein